MLHNGHDAVTFSPVAIEPEPDFRAEMTLAMSDANRLAWFQNKARAFAEDGAAFHRFSQDMGNTDTMIYEGWRTDPGVDGATDRRDFLGLD